MRWAQTLTPQCAYLVICVSSLSSFEVSVVCSNVMAKLVIVMQAEGDGLTQQLRNVDIWVKELGSAIQLAWGTVKERTLMRIGGVEFCMAGSDVNWSVSCPSSYLHLIESDACVH